MRIMRIAGVLTASFVAACNPIPIKSACDQPNLVPQGKFAVDESAATWGVFSNYCPVPIPVRLSMQTEPEVTVSIRVRGQWIDLRAEKQGKSLGILGLGVRALEFRGFTHSIRHDSLRDKEIRFTPEGHGEVAVPFEYVRCTCIGYDAV